MKEKEEKIKEIKTGIYRNDDTPRFSLLLFSSYVIVFPILTYYLFLFYLVILYDALTGGGSSTIIPDPEKFKAALAYNPILIVAPIFIAALGVFLHFIISHKKFKINQKTIGSAVVIGLGLIFDILIAKKIHTNINQKNIILKLETTNWYASEDFWIVIFMGFIAYLLWSGIFHAILTEWTKRNIRKWEDEQIHMYENEIETCKSIIIAHQENRDVKLATEINEIKGKIAKLSNELTEVKIPTGTLKKWLSSFYMGWITFLQKDYQQPDRKVCNEVYETYIKSIENDENKK